MHDETKVYFIEASHACDTFVKVGMAVDPYSRIANVMCGCPLSADIVRTVSIRTRDKAGKVERALHKFLIKFHARGEWFTFPNEEKNDFYAYASACLNMELGAGAWSFVEIDWTKHEENLLQNRRDYLMARKGPPRQSRKARAAEWNRHRQFDRKSGN